MFGANITLDLELNVFLLPQKPNKQDSSFDHINIHKESVKGRTVKNKYFKTFF